MAKNEEEKLRERIELVLEIVEPWLQAISQGNGLASIRLVRQSVARDFAKIIKEIENGEN